MASSLPLRRDKSALTSATVPLSTASWRALFLYIILGRILPFFFPILWSDVLGSTRFNLRGTSTPRCFSFSSSLYLKSVSFIEPTKDCATVSVSVAIPSLRAFHVLDSHATLQRGSKSSLVYGEREGGGKLRHCNDIKAQ